MTTPDQEEVTAVAEALLDRRPPGVARVLRPQVIETAKSLIQALDQHRADNQIVPSYMIEVPPEIADDLERTVRSIARTHKMTTGLFRFKDKDSTNA